MADSHLEVHGESPVFKILDSSPKILMKIGAGVNVPDHTECFEVWGWSGTKIASMNYDGVVTSHVDDPVKAINEMLESEICQEWSYSQLRATLILLRAYFLCPQPDSWKTQPLL